MYSKELDVIRLVGLVYANKQLPLLQAGMDKSILTFLKNEFKSNYFDGNNIKKDSDIESKDLAIVLDKSIRDRFDINVKMIIAIFLFVITRSNPNKKIKRFVPKIKNTLKYQPNIDELFLFLDKEVKLERLNGVARTKKYIDAENEDIIWQTIIIISAIEILKSNDVYGKQKDSLVTLVKPLGIDFNVGKEVLTKLNKLELKTVKNPDVEFFSNFLYILTNYRNDEVMKDNLSFLNEAVSTITECSSLILEDFTKIPVKVKQVLSTVSKKYIKGDNS